MVLVEVVVKGDVALVVGFLHMLCCCLASEPRDDSKWYRSEDTEKQVPVDEKIKQ